MKHPSLTKALFILACSFCSLAGNLTAGEVQVELYEGWNFSKGEEYPGAVGSLEPGSAEKTMVLSYDFNGGGQYVAAAKNLDPAGELSGVEVTASGPGGNLGVALIDNTDQTFIYRLGTVDDVAKTFDLTLDKPSTSYGGPDDKTLHFPLKAIRLLVEKSPAQPEGKITVTALVFRTP